MNIGNILHSYQFGQGAASANPAALAAQSEQKTTTSEKILNSQSDTVTISPEAQNKFSAARQIMSQYDVRNISHNSLVKMGRELYEQGVIDGNELMNLSKPTLDRELPGNANNNQTQGPDQAKDYIRFYENKIEFLQSHGSDASSVKFASQMLAKFRNLAALQ